MPLDKQGFELQVGDTVAFATLAFKRAYLRVGWIVGFETVTLGDKELITVKIQYLVGTEKRGLTKFADQVVRVVQ